MPNFGPGEPSSRVGERRDVPATTAPHVVLFGTSISARGTWQDDLAKGLSTSFGAPVRVTRVAKGGATSEWGLAALPDVIALHPQVVVIEFAINDADLRRPVTLSRSAGNARTLIERLQLSVPASCVLLMTTGPALGLRGWLRPRLDAFYEQYRDVAREKHVGLIDLEPAWKRLTGAELYAALPDGVHPTSDAMVTVALPTMLDVIGSTLRAGCS